MMVLGAVVIDDISASTYEMTECIEDESLTNLLVLMHIEDDADVEGWPLRGENGESFDDLLQLFILARMYNLFDKKTEKILFLIIKSA